MLLLPLGKASKYAVQEFRDFRMDRTRRGTTDILDALADAVKLSVSALDPLQPRPRRSVILTDEERAKFYSVDEAVKELIGGDKPQLRFDRQLRGVKFSYLGERN